MGNINLRAIEDYDEKKGRHTELEGETKRLDEQRRDLIKLMDELNEKKKIALGKVFDRHQRELPADLRRALRRRRGGADAGEPGVAVRGAA